MKFLHIFHFYACQIRKLFCLSINEAKVFRFRMEESFFWISFDIDYSQKDYFFSQNSVIVISFGEK